LETAPLDVLKPQVFVFRPFLQNWEKFFWSHEAKPPTRGFFFLCSKLFNLRPGEICAQNSEEIVLSTFSATTNEPRFGRPFGANRKKHPKNYPAQGKPRSRDFPLRIIAFYPHEGKKKSHAPPRRGVFRKCLEKRTKIFFGGGRRARILVRTFLQISLWPNFAAGRHCSLEPQFFCLLGFPHREFPQVSRREVVRGFFFFCRGRLRSWDPWVTKKKHRKTKMAFPPGLFVTNTSLKSFLATALVPVKKKLHWFRFFPNLRRFFSGPFSLSN